MKRRLLGLQDGCCARKRRVPTNVAKVVELVKELLLSSFVPVNTVLSSEVPVTTKAYSTELPAEMEESIANSASLESGETISFCRHEELLQEFLTRHAEETRF